MWRPRLIVELDAPGAGNWQLAMSNTERTRWYLAEALKVYDPLDPKLLLREDTLVHRFSLAAGSTTGKYLDTMRLQADAGSALHFTSMGVEDDGTLWVTWGHDIVRLKYAVGTRTLTQTTPLGLELPGVCQLALSPTRTRAVVRRLQATTETYTRRGVDDLLDGTDRIYGVPVVVPRRDDRVVQGFGLSDYSLYIATGLGVWAAKLEEYDLATGEYVTTHGAEHFGPLVTDARAWDYRELEGVQGKLLGVKLRGYGPDLFRVFDTEL